ncbi:uncharacterized protein [Henckelia pumila]|uniref:uncharacterized protein isoform X2 n=1 Tax=Henckelia pumila TaxID=405737 RepID=UPI003C6E7E3E
MAPLRGLRGRLQTMSRNTVLCDDRVMIQPIQVFWFLGSLMSYLGAFYFSTKMPEFNAIYRRAGGNTNIPHLVSSFFLDLIFVDYKDMGMTEMLQVAQLAVLYAIGHQNILLMFLISTLIFLRLVLLFFLKEFLNWYRRQNVTPVRDEAELNTNARLNQDDLEAGRVESECTVESG